MRISTPKLLALALTTTAVSLIGCGDAGTGSSGLSVTGTGPGSGTDGPATGDQPTAASGANTDDSGGDTGACASSDFDAQVIAFCKAQNPPTPEPGELGASCTDDTQCASQICLEPFGSPQTYCSWPCPAGDECPLGFNCQDTGTSLGSVCYQGVCIYGGSDAADCTTNLLAELDAACMSECSVERIEGWLNCLAGAGRLCGTDSADEQCGVERGLLESCCGGCDPSNW
ncbi:hypothetical protein [Nannocystis sp. SCPEA4]|uniref:hypothetical protein n=1 Tax=Nannocystis sp. SCPEA4 TaxID=2996787 RepID=UPI00226F7D24|nr:hypothetical protein [Nannocystis sp. SCPEA4]MCY1054743.1 hypothetical protein [Nannocystis sp. SCPEA4]